MMIPSILSEILVKRLPIILFLFGTPVMANPRIGNMGIDNFKTGRQFR